MSVKKDCNYCNTQKIVNNNHVRNIDGELTRVCPICYHSMSDLKI